MDFSQRAAQSQQPVNPQNSVASPQHPANRRGSRSKGGFQRWLKISSIVLLFSATILAVALLIYIAIGGPRSESKYINKDDYQAVFLNGGQVYFGHLNTLNDKFLRIDDIYYLRVNQQVQPNQSNQPANNDVSLVKLGCELHGPTDEMLINRDQVIFWENLKSDGQVAKAISTYKQQNPNGQNCNQNSQSTPTSNATPSTTTPAPTTPSTSTPSSSTNSTTKKQ